MIGYINVKLALGERHEKAKKITAEVAECAEVTAKIADKSKHLSEKIFLSRP
jgi:hypothetical protein